MWWPHWLNTENTLNWMPNLAKVIHELFIYEPNLDTHTACIFRHIVALLNDVGYTFLISMHDILQIVISFHYIVWRAEESTVWLESFFHVEKTKWYSFDIKRTFSLSVIISIRWISNGKKFNKKTFVNLRNSNANASVQYEFRPM